MQKARRRPKASTACRHTVSGSFSLPYSGFFSPFPHGTRSLSVSQEYLALSDGSDRFRQDFTCPALLRILVSFKHISHTRLSLLTPSFPTCSAICLKSNVPVLQPQNCRNNLGLGYFHFARRYSGNHYCFLLLRLLRCFSSARSLLGQAVVTCLQHAGFPHSEMYVSKNICFSTYLIAAYHVLLRL